MISFFDPIYQKGSYVPVVHGYYDRADMMQTTPEEVNHAHSLCEIMYVTEGMMSIETADGVARVGRKQFIWLDANVRHWDLKFSDGLCSMMNVEYQYEALDTRAPTLRALARYDASTANFLAHPLPYIVLTDREDTVFHLMKEIVHLSDSAHEQSERLCSILCTQLIMEVARLGGQYRGQAAPVNNTYVSEALAIMQRDYAESLTAASIASRLHIQPTYLHRLFKEHTTLTMGEHLQRIRVQRAQELLLSTDDTLLDIASAVGIGSQQHFSQLFRRAVGMTPSEYRKQYRDAALSDKT